MSLDSEGKLTSALFSTSRLSITGGDSAVYNLSAAFSETRNPIAKNVSIFLMTFPMCVNCSEITKMHHPCSRSTI